MSYFILSHMTFEKVAGERHRDIGDVGDTFVSDDFQQLPTLLLLYLRNKKRYILVSHTKQAAVMISERSKIVLRCRTSQTKKNVRLGVALYLYVLTLFCHI